LKTLLKHSEVLQLPWTVAKANHMNGGKAFLKYKQPWALCTRDPKAAQ